MVKFKSISCILLAILIFGKSFAESPVDKFVNHSILKNALISISVVDLNTNKQLYAYWDEHPITPASTLKLITTATALEKLGPDFKYKTIIGYQGGIKDGILNGDLYIIGSGDPSLASAKTLKNKEQDPGKLLLDLWVKKVREAGIIRIKGNIVADISCFDTVGVNPKWTWDDIGNYYAPGIYGISYLDNALKVKFKTGKTGQKAQIISTDPLIPEIEFRNSVKGTETKSDNAYFYGIPGENLRFVSGEIPAEKESFIVKCDIPKPGLLLARNFKTSLISSGISVEGKEIQLSVPKDKINTLFIQESPELIEIIKETNMKSNNHYAEYLFRTIGLQKEKPATIKNSLVEIKSFWKSKGLPLNQLLIYDGCGLSPNNAVSAKFYTDLLNYMYKSKYRDEFVKSLPVAGKSGSMSGVLRESRLNGKVWAKSGTIDNVKAYAGYVFDGNKKLSFAIIVNNAAGNSWQVLSKIESFLLDL